MKSALVIVSMIAVFTVDCRDFSNGPGSHDSTDNAQLFSNEPEDQLFDDEDQKLEKEPIMMTGIWEEKGETETRQRRSRCKARNACVVMGGFCVTNATLCSTRLVPEGCKGTNCQCCIPELVNQCVDETAMKETVNEGNDNVTQSVNQCVDETVMKETVNEGNNNVTRALEIKINKLETELQNIKNKVSNSLTGCPKGFILLSSPSNQCLKFFNDQFRNYDQAKAKCQAEGMVLAKPYDPVTLRSYLITRYGNSAAWIGARGDGSYIRWERDNVIIYSNNIYWRTGHPGTGVRSSNCLRLEALYGDWAAEPTKPYWSTSCTAGGTNTLCELIIE